MVAVPPLVPPIPPNEAPPNVEVPPPPNVAVPPNPVDCVVVVVAPKPGGNSRVVQTTANEMIDV